jgi:BlaI family transcriptional regulator, penicillinase repressor
MPRRPSDTLTEREAQIMDALWELGEGTAEQVRNSLTDRLHDSTIRTMLRILERKGYARHEVRHRVYFYRPVVPRQKAQRRALRTILARFFQGSAAGLVLQLIEDERITPEQLAELQQTYVASRSKAKRGRPETGVQNSEGAGQ